MRHGKREPVVTIPPVVGPVVIRVEPATIVVTVRAEQVRIAVGLREASSMSPPLEYTTRVLHFSATEYREEKIVALRVESNPA